MIVGVEENKYNNDKHTKSKLFKFPSNLHEKKVAINVEWNKKVS